MAAAAPVMRPLAENWRPKLPVATDMLEWQIVNGSRTPGPGAYAIPTTMTQSGGRFGSAITKSNLELTIDSKRNQPGPNAYMMPDLMTNMPGGRMGTGERPKSDVDWAIHRAKQGPGPGEYVIPTTMAQNGGRFGKNITKSELELHMDRVRDEPAPHDYDVNSSFTYLHSEQKLGGVMAGRGPKSDVDWAIYTASKIPGPGEYVIPTTMAQNGGRFGSAITKSALELAINRVKNDPAPHDYNLEQAYSYMHSEQKVGGVMAGRSGCGPAKMPAPFAQFGNDSATEGYRGQPSGSHGDACAPWKNEEAWSKVRKEAIKSGHVSEMSGLSGPSEPNVSGGSAQSQPNELIKDYDEQGRAAPPPQQLRKVVDRASLEPEKRPEVLMPWRDPDAWSKVAKRPDPQASIVRAVVEQEKAKISESKTASAPLARGIVKTEVRKDTGQGHTTVVAPWRDADNWRAVARDPSVPELPLPAEVKADRTAVETPWRVQSWAKVGNPKKKKKATILAPVEDTADEASSSVTEPATAVSSKDEAGSTTMSGISEKDAEEMMEQRRAEKLSQIKRLRQELSAVKASLVVVDPLVAERPRTASGVRSNAQVRGGMLGGGARRVPVGRRRSTGNLTPGTVSKLAAVPAVYGSDAGMRAELEGIYAKHNPEKLQDVEHLCYKYRGREADLLKAVRKKYELSV